jgi:hypothetical protein
MCFAGTRADLHRGSGEPGRTFADRREDADAPSLTVTRTPARLD